MSYVPDPTDPLSELCPQCNEPIGDHKLRDWIAHTNVGHSEISHTDIEPNEFQFAQLGNITPSDTIDYRCFATESPLGNLGIVEIHWQQGTPYGNKSVCKTYFISTAKTLRTAGKLLHQAFNRAANVSEGLK